MIISIMTIFRSFKTPQTTIGLRPTSTILDVKKSGKIVQNSEESWNNDVQYIREKLIVDISRPESNVFG